MDTQEAIFNVEASALFYVRPKPDMGDLLLELNAKLANEAGCHMTVSPLSHDDWWLLSCEQFHIMIAFSDTPAPADKLDNAVRSPINSVSRFDYTQAVESHRMCINIEVGDGHAPLPPEARLIMQEFGDSKVCSAELKMKALHWTTQFIGQHESFLAVHFGPSDRLFCPEELKAAAGFDLPTPLLTHPVPSLPEEGPNGVDGYALTLKNAHHLNGPAIELEGVPVKVPLAASVSLLNTLRTAHAKGKLPLEHGKILKPSEKMCLYVREAQSDSDHREGRFILSFWSDRGHDQPMQKPAPVVEQSRDEQPQKGKIIETFLQRKAQEAVQNANDSAAELQPVEDHNTPSDDQDTVVELAPQGRGLDRMGGLFSRRFGRGALESRIKVASIALIFGLPFLWNPYSDFTGGMSLQAPQVADAAPEVVTPTRSLSEVAEEGFKITLAAFTANR